MMRTNAIKTARVSAFMKTRPKLKPASTPAIAGTEAKSYWSIFKLLRGRLELSATRHYYPRGQKAYRNVRWTYPLVEAVFSARSVSWH